MTWAGVSGWLYAEEPCIHASDLSGIFSLPFLPQVRQTGAPVRALSTASIFPDAMVLPCVFAHCAILFFSEAMSRLFLP